MCDETVSEPVRISSFCLALCTKRDKAALMEAHFKADVETRNPDKDVPLCALSIQQRNANAPEKVT
jgi:hypothetical protein